VQIAVQACEPGTELGSGAFVDDDLVLTSAHTLRGAREIIVRRGEQSVPAEVVGFDPDVDLAYLRADLDPHHPLTVDSSGVEAGDRGVAWVVRQGVAMPLPVTVSRPVRINTEDIYVEGSVTRPGFELEADIRPGDSGGPVMVDGKVIGVVFARSRAEGLRSYAIDPVRGGDRIDAQLASGVLGDVDLARCP
jgi:S1-C subfamily serine protease